MQRILIIGRMASGKSTFAERLGRKLGLPVYHLDSFYWKPGWVRPGSQEVWIETVKSLLERDSWIIDGNYGNTLQMRMQRADTIIVFAYPAVLCLWRSLKRLFTSGDRPFDKAAGVKERISWKLFAQILKYDLSATLNKVDKYRTTQQVLVVRNDQDAQELL